MPPINLWDRECCPGAYVTLEHEYILILRKGERRAIQDLPENK